MLRTHPALPVPTNCGQCELSYPLGDEHTVAMVCCIRKLTHHKSSQPLCPWYIRLGVGDLRVELAFQVPPHLKALDIHALPQPASVEAILNIIQNRQGKHLATIKRNDYEKSAPNKTPH